MKKQTKKLLALCLTLCLVLTAVVLVLCLRPQKHPSIVILYENDVHCAVEGYSKLAALKNELKGQYDHVGVVSSGDFVQGGTLGAVSKGEYIVELMNRVGYDAISLGNHEFDYLLPRLNELNSLSNTKFLSCNFQKIGENTSYFDPYTIVSYGNVDVAYIGITTPETITSTNPAQFKDQEDRVVFTFHESDLYQVVQSNINAALQAGAEYVVALSHLGYAQDQTWQDVTDLIENTQGLDVVLDAHSHSVIEEMVIKDKSGDPVLLSSTGTKFEHVGKLILSENGLDTQLVKTESLTATDPTVDTYLTQINESYAQLGNRKIGQSLVELNTHDGDTRLVRNNELAIGNLCSDALRITTGADLAFVNGGGIRAPLGKGDITFNDIFSVFPFNNQVVTARVSGQVILDMLEMGVMNYPLEDGSFPHVSGLTFTLDASVTSSVQVDDNGFFTGVTGSRRVLDAKILSQDGSYKPLDPEAAYTIAGFNYFILDHGGGMAMFKNAKLLDGEGTLDVELLESYITNHLNGVIGDQYSAPQGRIKVVQATESSQNTHHTCQN